MKRIIGIWILLLCLCLVGCGKNKTNKDTEILEQQSFNGDTVVTKMETVQRENKKLTEIDIFTNVCIKYDGWNELGEISEINMEKCNHFVRENVEFKIMDEYHNLANGDTITIMAEYDEEKFKENGFQILSDTKDYFVEGLRQIVSGQQYHDDVVWVKVEFDDTTQWCCCDKEGNILFSLDIGSEPTTYFSNGVAIVDYNRIINKSGEVIWSTEQDGVAIGNELWGEGNVKDIELLYDTDKGEFFGYTPVKFYIESFEITAEITGILDNAGNWHLEPMNAWFLYEGDGLYHYFIPNGYNLPNESKWYTYNVFTTEVVEGQRGIGDEAIWSKDFYLERHNGLIFIWDDYPDISGFYDSNGSKVIDLSKYTLVTFLDEPEFNEGYSFLEMENAQGTQYYTIIDTTGTEMFAPQKSVKHEKLRCGFYWVKDVGYMNVHGDIAFDIPLKSGDEFSNDMARVWTTKSTQHYINSNGEVVF